MSHFPSNCRFAGFLCCALFLAMTSVSAQNVTPQDKLAFRPAVDAIVDAFSKHPLVAISEFHESATEHAFFRELIANPRFTNEVDAIVIEFGNPVYQSVLDAYVRGDDVELNEVRKVWRNTYTSPMGAWSSDLYERFIRHVRDVNAGLEEGERLRVIAGGSSIDWERVQTPEECAAFRNRDERFARTVLREVLGKELRALLIAGGRHFYRDRDERPVRPLRHHLEKAAHAVPGGEVEIADGMLRLKVEPTGPKQKTATSENKTAGNQVFSEDKKDTSKNANTAKNKVAGNRIFGSHEKDEASTTKETPYDREALLARGFQEINGSMIKVVPPKEFKLLDAEGNEIPGNNLALRRVNGRTTVVEEFESTDREGRRQYLGNTDDMIWNGGAGNMIEQRAPGSLYVIRFLDPYAMELFAEHRAFERIPKPGIASIEGTWLGRMPAMAFGGGDVLIIEGSPRKLQQEAEAVLYLGPADEHQAAEPAATYLNDAKYQEELRRRRKLMGLSEEWADVSGHHHR